MDINKLLSVVLMKDGRVSPKADAALLREDPALHEQLYRATSFLPLGVAFKERVYCVKHGITSAPTCSVCQSPVRFHQNRYADTCSLKCRASSAAVRQKTKQTNLEKYGVAAPANNVVLREKSRESLMALYGVESPLQSAEIQQRRKQTLIDKFGTSNTNHIESIQRKRMETCYAKYGDHSSRRHWTDSQRQLTQDVGWLQHQHVVLKKPIVQIAKELGISDKILGDYFHKHQIQILTHNVSSGEREILDFITSLGVATSGNDRTILSRHELDIYVPEHNLAIEYCGLYWHSDEFKDRLYHYNKLRECASMGIRLLTIFEDEWVEKPELVKDKIQHILGMSSKELIYARKTTVCELSTIEKDKFFNRCHIQGTGPGSVTYGLSHGDQIVAAMSFIQQKNGVFILNRFATVCRVPGAFEKLLSHFKNNHPWKQLVSFADMRWSTGQLYERTGWTLDKELPVDYYWCKGGKRYHKFGFRHKHLINKLPQYDPALSETDNCKNNGYTRIYNCGLKRYTLTNGESR